jgi:AraC-like DNA-binding protein
MTLIYPSVFPETKNLMSSLKKQFAEAIRSILFDTRKIHHDPVKLGTQNPHTQNIPKLNPIPLEIPHQELNLKISELQLGYQMHFMEEDLSLHKMSQHLKIPTIKLKEFLKIHIQKTHLELLNDTRINKAKSNLTTTDQLISQIAFDVGFKTVSHFNRTFKKHTSFSPSKFRASQKALANISD